MKIFIACDHAGFELKELVCKYLKINNIEFLDCGTDSNSSVDYPDFIHSVIRNFDQYNSEKLGIIICGSGNGVNMTANKYKHIRSALCWNVEIAEMARLHNNANFMALPARYLNNDDAISIVESFINTNFEGGRHINRVSKINKLYNE